MNPGTCAYCGGVLGSAGAGASFCARCNINFVWSAVGYSVEPEPAPKPPAPVEPGPELRALNSSVIGYRAWRIMGWQLMGTGVNEAWAPGVNEARCSNREWQTVRHDAAPDADCSCGLYALARFAEGAAWWQNVDVLGAVEAWADADEHNHDRFFVHSTGFRAQYAKVVLLATDDEYPRAQNAAIRALAAEHGADVCRREHLEDAAKEHGQLVPDEWLEWAREESPTAGPSALGLALQQWQQQLLSQWFTPPVWTYGTGSGYATGGSVTWAKTPPTRRKGIRQTLGYPGPPADPTVKYRKGDRVSDRRGVVWRCTRGGKPGEWERED